MMFRSALVRLAAQYFVLLVLIIGFLNVIVYLTVSQALQDRVNKDLASALKQAQADLMVTGDTISVNPQVLLDPSYADTFIWVLQIAGKEQVVLPSATLSSVFKSPSLDGPKAAARVGQSTDTQVNGGQQLFVVHTAPIRNSKSHHVVGVLEVAQPISWVNDALSRLEGQLIMASAVGLILGALASLLMATRSLRPILAAFDRQREFVADASHELRTPLTLIRTNVEALQRRVRGGGAPYARGILDEVDQLNRIVSDLTTLALADARQLPIERKPMELNEVVLGLVNQSEPLAQERGVTLRPELNGGARIQADAGRVRQLLLILLDNALTHTPPGGEVSIGVARENGQATVTVRDSGEGIAPEDLPHIFERFYRADKTRAAESGGSGLGLAIAKWIVDAHRGEIEVTSTEGHGTQVEVSLPAID